MADPITIRAASLALAASLAGCAAPTPAPASLAGRSHLRLAGEAFRSDDYALARQHLDAVDRLDHVDWPLRVDVDHLRGRLRLAEEDVAGAVACFDRSIVRAERADYPTGALESYVARLRIWTDRGEWALADADLERAARLADRVGTREARGAVQRERAHLIAARGRLTEALAVAREAVRLFAISPDRRENIDRLARSRCEYAALLEAVGEPVDALFEYRRARDLARGLGDAPLEGRATEGIARSLRAAGHEEDARIRFRQAAEVWERIGEQERAGTAAREAAGPGI